MSTRSDIQHWLEIDDDDVVVTFKTDSLLVSLTFTASQARELANELTETAAALESM